jgi:threonylcarbamoyladenosine tRNA methylthiotransferase MtaB
MPAFAITSLGCKVNQYDAQAVAQACRDAGLHPARRGETVDLAVIVTCCVTATAAAKSRQTLRRFARRHPRARIAVLGCYAAAHADRIRDCLLPLLPGDRPPLIAGGHDDLAERLHRFLAGEHPDEANAGHDPEPRTPATLKRRRAQAAEARSPGPANLPTLREFIGHQRAFVKVQDGCDAFCNYCIVPYTRPVVRSRPVEDVLDECRSLLDAGHRELVLCGVFLGAYGQPTAIRRHWDQPRDALAGLLRAVADLPGLWRVRLSSLEPGDVSDALLDLLADHPRVAPHLHLPAQSGSDRMLRAMNRQYSVENLRQTAATLHRRLDRPALSTDLIVGYPGETDDDFRRTLELVREVGFMKLHVFPFSPVEPTGAWHRRHHAPPQPVVPRRIDELNALGKDLASRYREQFVGDRLEAIVESTRPEPGTRQAMSDRYLTVAFPAPPTGRNLTGQVVTLAVDRATPAGLQGVVVADSSLRTL